MNNVLVDAGRHLWHAALTVEATVLCIGLPSTAVRIGSACGGGSDRHAADQRRLGSVQPVCARALIWSLHSTCMGPLYSMAMLQTTVMQHRSSSRHGCRAALQVAVMHECGLDGMHPRRTTLQQAAALLRRAFEVCPLLPPNLHCASSLLQRNPCGKLSCPLVTSSAWSPAHWLL
jgi:hypothetical protein